MTTIVCTRTEMVADSQATDESGKTSVQKIFRLKGLLVGIAGGYGEGLLFVEWLKDRRRAPPDLTDGFYAIVLRASGIELWESTLIAQPVAEEYHAIGSGAAFALGALDAGATPVEAVEISARRDPYTGGGIMLEKLKRRR